MRVTGQTLFRLCGAVILGLGAARIDTPRQSDSNAAPNDSQRVVGRTVLRLRPTGMAARPAAGMRAFLLPIRNADVSTGLIRPGARVNVFLVPYDGPRRTATLVESNLRVLSIAAIPERGAVPGARTYATLEVTPEYAAALVAAAARGDLVPVLSGPPKP